MKNFTIEVITEVFNIEANSEAEAEAKYDAYWTEGRCPDHPELSVSDCGCLEYSDSHTYHTIKEDY